jgi:hypothetical protein
LRPIWDRYDIRPVYFVSPEVANDNNCCEILKKEIERGSEIGAHLHSEYIEPEKKWHFPLPVRIRVNMVKSTGTAWLSAFPKNCSLCLPIQELWTGKVIDKPLSSILKACNFFSSVQYKSWKSSICLIIFFTCLKGQFN